MKTRFTANDVRAEVRDLRSIVLGLRVINVYDVDAKTYLLKLASPGKEKVILLLESGARFHTTRFGRDKSDMPSAFAMKLRKHIRSKRLEDVRQISMDRVVDFKFGSGEDCCHIILELYASGNIILTDHKYEILQLLRVHVYDSDATVAVRQVYPADRATADESESGIPYPGEDGAQQLQKWLRDSSFQLGEDAKAAAELATEADGVAEGKKGVALKAKKAAKKAKQVALKQMLLKKGSGVSPLGPALIDHCIELAGLQPGMKLPTDGKTDALTLEQAQSLVAALRTAPEIMGQLDRPGEPGHIVCHTEEDVARPGSRGADGGEGSKSENKSVAVFDEFLPHVLAQHRTLLEGGTGGVSILNFPSFDGAVDEFFSKMEDQRIRAEIASAERAAQKRVENVRQKLEDRRAELEVHQKHLFECAASLEDSAQAAEAALTVLRSALDNGVNWGQLQDLVDAETKAGNPIASLVKSLKLDAGRAVLRLPNVVSEGHVDIDVDVMLSAHANAREMYDQRRKAIEKAEKTLAASEKAVKATQHAAEQDLKNRSIKRTLAVARRTLWFEKFNWFITSENYLVLSGRDAQQNEVLVKRYLRPCDIYVHADLQGASTCIVRSKDPTGKKAISPLAIAEAGSMAVCRSNAWSAKIVTSAWWVYSDQVSKTAPTGEFLTSGSFMIRGKKNFLPPCPLEMGFGILFRLEDDSIHRHLGERQDRIAGGEWSAPFGRGRKPEAGGEDEFARPEPAANRKHVLPRSGGADAEEDGSPPQIRGASGKENVRGGMEEEAGGTEEEDTHVASAVGGKKRLTAKERRQLKKGGGESSVPAPPLPAGKEQPAASREAARPPVPPAVGSSKPPRGKKGKLKLMKKKYRDQDEEDRELAMELLGKGDTPKKVKGKSKQVETEQEVARREIMVNQSEQKLADEANAAYEALPDGVRQRLSELADEGFLPPKPSLDAQELRSLGSLDETDALSVLSLFAEADTRKVRNRSGFLSGIMRRYQEGKKSMQEAEAEAAASVPGETAPAAAAIVEPPPGKSRTQAKKQEEEDLRALLEEEGDGDLEAGGLADVLDRLTAVPLSLDTLLHAIPVCGPYSSLQSFKYKVKLVPGQQKKGKATKQAVEVFTRFKDCTPRERDLIKALQDTEMVASMIGDVKLTVAGLAASKQAAKKSKKAKAKQRGQKK